MNIVGVGEFIDALDYLERGHVLIISLLGSVAIIDSARVYAAHEILLRHNLLEEVHTKHQSSGIRCYRLNFAGMCFARRALLQWRSLPLYRRLLARFLF